MFGPFRQITVHQYDTHHHCSQIPRPVAPTNGDGVEMKERRGDQGADIPVLWDLEPGNLLCQFLVDVSQRWRDPHTFPNRKCETLA